MPERAQGNVKDEPYEPRSFNEFARKRWGSSWTICRATKRNRERYGTCISNTEYRRGHDSWIDERWNRLMDDTLHAKEPA